MRRILFVASLAMITISLFSQPVSECGFTHPGMLHSAEDLNRIRKNVADNKEPWASAWTEFLKSKWLADDYQPRPLEIVGRGVGSVGQDNIQNDCSAAYYNVLAWYISGNEKFARKAADIINAWSYKVKVINGKDAVLCAGIYGYKFANAAEILRFSYKKWTQKDIDQCKKMLVDVFYPVIKDFAPFANGNWDTACLPTMMSIGIFCDNREMFDCAVKYYFVGAGDGGILNYIINDSGQCQESGRDQPHTQVGIAHLAEAAEIGFHQGLNMYGVYNNRLLKGFEYTCKYNLGNDDVPFVPTFDRTGKYNHKVISTKGRRNMTFSAEMVLNQFKIRLRLEAQFTEQMATDVRPEPASIDMPGAGTLLFTQASVDGMKTDESKIPSMPGGLVAKSANNAISLNWKPVINATSYAVLRTNIKMGLKTIPAANLRGATYTDKDVQSGEIYSYTIQAQNKAGESPASLATTICAGLPTGWKNADIGKVETEGTTNFDGKIFTIEGAGTDIGGANDQFQYAYLPLSGDAAITARFVPQVASQFVKMGLMVRESLSASSKHASLLIMPLAGKDIEVPTWHSNLVVRKATGDSTVLAVQSPALTEPFITWGRFVEPYWLRLSRKGKLITASVSKDGVSWTKVGETSVELKKELLVGLAVCSRLTKVTTVARFDHVEIKKTK